jgi:hypothetical protein
MASQSTTGAPLAATQAVLVCRLRAKQLQRGHSSTAGEIELENASAEVVEIEYDMHPLQYLNLVVTDSAGVAVTEGHYGDVFSPLGKTRTFSLSWGRCRRRNDWQDHTRSVLFTTTTG